MTRFLTLIAFALTSTSWSTVVSGHGWYWRTLALTAAAAAVAATSDRVLTHRGPGHGLALVTGALGLIWMVTGGPVPSPSAVIEVSEVLQRGAHVSNTTAAPLPPEASVVPLVAGVLFWLWWAADLLAVGAEVPGLAAVALLAVYGVPAAVLSRPVPTPYFAAGAVGLVLLLIGGRRRRMAGWGPLVGRSRPAAGTVGAAVTAVLALAVTATVPVWSPTVRGGLVYEARHADSGTSTALSTDLDLHQDLIRPSDRPLLEYTSTSADPDPLRMFTVDSLDGDRWEAVPFTSPSGGGTLATPSIRAYREDTERLNPALVRRRTQQVTATVKALHQHYLPIPGDPLWVRSTAGPWLLDALLNTVRGPETTRGMKYTVRYRQFVPRQSAMSRRGLRAVSPGERSEVAAYLRVPTNTPAVVTETARRVAGPATVSDYVRAQRLQAYFQSGNFTYGTSVNSSTSPSAMATFLRDRRGYCVHFATTMTLMARSLGVPARVVVGLAPGDRNGSTWTAREHDAHAWPELYFAGVGWVRFEPTVGQPTPSWTVPSESAAPSDTSTSSTAASSSTSSSSPSSSGAVPSDSPTETSSEEGAGRPRRPTWWWLPVAGVAALGSLLAGPAIVGSILRRRRRRGPDVDEAAWSELLARMAGLGGDVDPARTVRDTGRRLAKMLGPDQAAREALQRRVRAVERSRYADRGGPSGDRPATVGISATGGSSTDESVTAGPVVVEDPFADVDLVVRTAGARVGRRRRWTARWFPRLQPGRHR